MEFGVRLTKDERRSSRTFEVRLEPVKLSERCSPGEGAYLRGCVPAVKLLRPACQAPEVPAAVVLREYSRNVPPTWASLLNAATRDISAAAERWEGEPRSCRSSSVGGSVGLLCFSADTRRCLT